MLGEAIRRGHSLGFITLTMKHRKGQRLADLWKAAGLAWNRATGGRGWVTAQKRHGVAGWIRVWEVTYGRNGWHVHVHAVVVLPPGAQSHHLDQVAGPMFERWSKGLQSAGLAAPRLKAQDWHIVAGENAAVEVGDYLFKLVDQAGTAKGLGLELTHAQPGRARDDLKTRPVWGLLDDLRETGEVGPWREWEKSSKAKRQVAYSKGFKQTFAPEVEELTDEQIVDQEHGSAADDVIHWTIDQWRELVSDPARLPLLLEAAEVPGPMADWALKTLLDEWGIGYTVMEVLKGKQSTARPDSAGGATARARCHTSGVP